MRLAPVSHHISNQWLICESSYKIIYRSLGHCYARLARGTAQVGDYNHIVHRQQGMIAWKGLRFSHIERGNCDPIILKSFYECIVIDHTLSLIHI